MHKLPLFKKLEHALSLGNIPVQYFPATEDAPLPFLAVDIGTDDKDRQRLLAIHITEQELGQNIQESKKQHEEAPLVFIEFSVKYPFTFDPMYGKDIGSLLHFLNRQIKLPGFQMDEAENTIFFQYNLVTTLEGVSDILVLSLVGMIMLAVDMYSFAIETLATGDMSFNELMIQSANFLKEVQK